MVVDGVGSNGIRFQGDAFNSIGGQLRLDISGSADISQASSSDAQSRGRGETHGRADRTHGEK